MTLPLSKTLDPADFAELEPELTIVNRHFTAEREQHSMRRWEYALALRAISQWHGPHPWEKRTPSLVDVGGAGSPLWVMVQRDTVSPWNVTRVDPEINVTLQTYLQTAPRLADVVTCISVIEHVEDLDQFCYHLACLVAPGGLLFLTVDCCDALGFTDPPDTYHFRWMRKRIFNRNTVWQLARTFLERDLTIVGRPDYSWHGPQVYDYTFASLALVKRS